MLTVITTHERIPQSEPVPSAICHNCGIFHEGSDKIICTKCSSMFRLIFKSK